MSPFEIALIIIGIICIVISCFMIDHKKEETVDTEIGSVTEQILYSQLSEANSKISEHVSNLKEDIYEKTKDEMSQLSNEKIMAVHEYSDQVLGDIKKNHDEVMFLYQMLSDKETEIKKTMQELQNTKTDIESYCAMLNDTLNNRNINIDEQEAEASKRKTSRATTNRRITNPIEIIKTDEKEISVNDSAQKKAATTRKRTTTKKASSAVTKTASTLEEQSNHEEKNYIEAIQEIEKDEFSTHIDEIVDLSNQGLSVLDISKRLGLGQGEVQLVLDYKKNDK